MNSLCHKSEGGRKGMGGEGRGGEERGGREGGRER